MNNNYVYITFPAEAENVKLSRMIAAVFLSDLNPSMEELEDVKTAVSEAATNAVLHAYTREDFEKEKVVKMRCKKEENEFQVEILDFGKGIADIEKAMEPLYSTASEKERSGMGFTFMEAFMDEVFVESSPGKGTKVTMKKKIGYQGK